MYSLDSDMSRRSVSWTLSSMQAEKFTDIFKVPAEEQAAFIHPGEEPSRFGDGHAMRRMKPIKQNGSAQPSQMQSLDQGKLQEFESD